MPLVRGPFEIKWGDNVIADVEEVDFEYERDSEDYTTLDGRTLEVSGSRKVTATLTLLASDIQALAALLPQHFVPNGSMMSTGETVQTAVGAIDVAPASCDEALVYNNFDIVSCGNPGQVTRIVNARTEMEDVDVDDKLQKIMVKIIGEAAQGEGVVQFFKEGSIAVVS